MIKVVYNTEDSCISIYSSDFKSKEITLREAKYSVLYETYLIVGKMNDETNISTIRLPIQGTILFEI